MLWIKYYDHEKRFVLGLIRHGIERVTERKSVDILGQIWG